jgi:hypothetical protein
MNFSEIFWIPLTYWDVHHYNCFKGFICGNLGSRNVSLIVVILWSWCWRFERIFLKSWAYSQLGYPKGLSNGKRIAKDYFGFLLHLLFHDYSGLVYDYN